MGRSEEIHRLFKYYTLAPTCTDIYQFDFIWAGIVY